MTTLRMLAVIVVSCPALLLGLSGGAAHALCSVDPCGAASATLDCDQDGLSDAEECNGLSVAGGAGLDFPSCRDATATQPDCLDPVVPDVFVLFEKSATSVYDALGLSNAEAFGFVTQPAGGLPLRPHVLDARTVSLPSAPQPASVTSRQAALRLREVVTPPGFLCPVTSALGLLNGVTSANNAGVAQVFTQRILDHVDCVYDSIDPSIPAADRLGDKIDMVKHTTAHEFAHGLRNAPESVDRYGGHHYRTGTGCVMDQSTTYSSKRGEVAFFTPVAFCGPTQATVDAGASALGKVACEDPDDLLDGDSFQTGCLPVGP